MTKHSFTLIDLTHSLSSEITSWDSSCGFTKTIVLDYQDCTSSTVFQVQHITMHAGIGTHLDAPAHCNPTGMSVEQLPLNNLLRPCVMIDVSNHAHETYQIGVGDIVNFEKQYGTVESESCVIFNTGWSQWWKTPHRYRNNLMFPSLSLDAAKLLLERNIAGIGIDTLGPDLPDDTFPVHSLLLSAGKYIIENVANAHQLPPSGAYITALPLKISGGTESPIRLVGFTIACG